MKGSGLFRVLSLFLLVSSAAAWPWPDSLEHMEDMVMRRQESASSGMSSDLSINMILFSFLTS